MADIYVYGPIGDAWDPEAVTAAEFARQLAAAGDEDVLIHVNSAGGDVFDANAMSELVRAREGRVTCVIEGLAASAASYFALTADEVRMNPSALLMVHNPWADCRGEASDMRRTADLLDKVRSTIVRQYVSKTGMPEADVESLMDSETWLTADEALGAGFVDALTDDAPVAAMAVPEGIAARMHLPAALAGDRTEAGEPRENIDSAGVEPPAGSAGGGAGSASRVACVQGQFLTYQGETA